MKIELHEDRLEFTKRWCSVWYVGFEKAQILSDEEAGCPKPVDSVYLVEDEILLEFIELFVHKIYIEISDSWENMYMILLLEFTGTVVVDYF